MEHREGPHGPHRLGFSVCLTLVVVCLVALAGLVDVGSDLLRLGLGVVAAVSGASVIVQLTAAPVVEPERVRVAGRPR